MMPGMPQRQTPDYVLPNSIRHGTSSLFGEPP
jgi:hypothetical protein